MSIFGLDRVEIHDDRCIQVEKIEITKVGKYPSGTRKMLLDAAFFIVEQNVISKTRAPHQNDCADHVRHTFLQQGAEGCAPHIF